MESSAEKLFKRGVAAHQNGNLKEAEDFYRQVLQTEPRHADANHNLGVVGVSVGKTNVAIPLFMTAISSNPKEAQYWILLDGSFEPTKEKASYQANRGG